MSTGTSLGPPEPVDIGQLLISKGLVDETAVRECLDIQRQSGRTGSDTIPRLGELLVRRGHVTEQQVVEALAAQQKRILYCSRCKVQLNVVVRSDIREVKCARCEGTLVPPGSLRDLKVVDSSIIFIAKDPVPKEVMEAAKDASRRFGKYVLINEIGRGAVGVIFRAWDTYLSQYVALKMIKSLTGNPGEDRNSSWHETRVLSLLKEARSTIRLRHPNIVPIYDAGRIDEDFYISMEYLEGATLADHLQKARGEGRISPYYDEPLKYLRMMRDIARAVHYAHTRPSPIIHCDLKPSNVFIDRSGKGTVVDFGLAKELYASQPDQAGVIRGTPAYMSPEQAAGIPDDIDARTDVYGLGAILYELLAGRPPFLGDTMDCLRQAVRERPLSRARFSPGQGDDDSGRSRPLPRVPSELESICLRCLEKERSNRFGSAREVAEAIESSLRLRAPTPVLSPGFTPLSIASVRTGRRDPRFAWIRESLAVSMILAAVTLLVYLLVGLGSDDTRLKAAEREIRASVASLRPDRALALCRDFARSDADPALRLVGESRASDLAWADTFRRRLIHSLSEKHPRFASLRLRNGLLSDVTVTGAGSEDLTFVSGRGRHTVRWEELHPAELPAMALASLGELTPENRYGMALILDGAGEPESARIEFRKLHDGPLGPAARLRMEPRAR